MGLVLYLSLEANQSQFKEIEVNHQLLLAITHYWYIKTETERKDVFLHCFQNPRTKAVKPTTVAEKIPRQELQISFLHAIAEWQSLYYCVHCLNQLLQTPLHLLKPQEFLECSNLHSYIEAVDKDRVDKAFEDNKLGKAKYKKYCEVTTAVNVQPTIYFNTHNVITFNCGTNFIFVHAMSLLSL